MKVEVFDGCCAPVTAGVLDEAEAEELAAVFKVLADPARLRLLSLVAASDDRRGVRLRSGRADRPVPADGVAPPVDAGRRRAC